MYLFWCAVVPVLALPAARRLVAGFTGDRPTAVGLGCGAAAATVTAASVPPATASVLLVLCPVLMALPVIDARIHRLPDRLVLPAFPVVGAWLIATVIVTGTPDAATRAAAAAAAAMAVLAVPCAAGGMGFGDVKLGGLLGLITGWIGVDTAIAAGLAALLAGAGHGLVVAVRHGVTARLPFGPALLAGTAIGVVVTRG
ncbi:leader peptidase (prepilin peptidase)/N-methyltransferase [Stackebrandtia albiflava]|uniref:Leader peptidase (Prepilin peptidase)/N-methyltransferase n=1 Tax=Stackebrandtia albiflava TaxID=406432 RepID=A0A562VD15_9ACTN|nr:prepilin peptidase [Stackebrandtia albiflava]TWJ15738.1 leader peptidase (prepilin peptidase)/N-methyltransferase [Stackebrandtia albiflava]